MGNENRSCKGDDTGYEAPNMRKGPHCGPFRSGRCREARAVAPDGAEKPG